MPSSPPMATASEAALGQERRRATRCGQQLLEQAGDDGPEDDERQRLPEDAAEDDDEVLDVVERVARAVDRLAVEGGVGQDEEVQRDGQQQDDVAPRGVAVVVVGPVAVRVAVADGHGRREGEAERAAGRLGLDRLGAVRVPVGVPWSCVARRRRGRGCGRASGRGRGRAASADVIDERQTEMARTTTRASRLRPPRPTQMWNFSSSMLTSRPVRQSVIVTPASAPQTPMVNNWSR